MKRRHFLVALAGVATVIARPRFHFPLLTAPKTQQRDVLYISLHTADPGARGDCSHEARYPGYERVAVERSSAAWDAIPDGLSVKNKQQITFPISRGGYENISYFGVHDSDGHMLASGRLHFRLAMLSGTTPAFSKGSLEVAIG